MAETASGQAGRAPGGAPAVGGTVWHSLHRCPDCGSSCRIVRRPTGEVYLACMDRIDCGYQETLE